ncbi:hypothetical protein ACVWZW_002156 [Bradyrhizobium sp. F1.13.4]
MTVIESVVSAEAAERKMPPGVLVEGPVVEAKFRDSYISFVIMIGGSIAALVWAFWQGIGWVEVSVFAGTFALSTVGIGFMHRYFVHRSFRCGPVMRTLFAAIATMAVQGSILKWVSNHRRHHLHSDKPGDVHSPYYDGDGNPYVTFAKGMMHAQGGWVWDQATTDAGYYAKDILADPIAMFFTRTRWYWYALSAVIIPGRDRLRVRRRAHDDRLHPVLRPVPQLPHDHGDIAGQLGLPQRRPLRLPPLRSRRRHHQRVRDHDPHLRRRPAQQPSPVSARRLHFARLVRDRHQRPDHSRAW